MFATPHLILRPSKDADLAPFIGAVGLTRVKFQACFTPALEVAWRLHNAYWEKGYATEAARAAIEDGFTRFGSAEIVASTALGNTASAHIMDKLGMTRAFAFDHPLSADGTPLCRRVLCRLTRS